MSDADLRMVYNLLGYKYMTAIMNEW
jgi:hypothetical protein